MNVIYYIQINVICIAILLLIRSRLHTKSGLYSTDRLIFNSLIWVSVVMCVSDIFAWSFNGSMIAGARIILEASNLVFYETLAVVGYLWALYVRVKLGLITDLSLKNKKLLIPSIPLMVFTAAAATNPFTHFFFDFDSANIYARGVGIYLHWVVTWMYLIVPTIRVTAAVIKAPNRMKKQELMPMLSFIAAPAVASLVQMFSYGITSSQAGITFSVLMIYITTQDEQILTDSLTGLNNRRGFDNYITDRIARHSGNVITIFMLDINGFKQVNDRLGHIVGDKALIEAAKVLKKACSVAKTRLFLCRYGGDEFLLCGESCGKEDQDILIKQINDGFAAVTDQPFTLSVSIGRASGVCEDYQSAEALIQAADEEMYEVKKRYSRSSAQTGR